MGVRDYVDPVSNAARAVVEAEVEHWRDEIERPWREGRQTTPARVGRWIGVGLTAAALIAGVVAALRVERPWEE